MSDYIWKLYDRKETDLISHLCRIRAIDPKALEPDFTEHLHNPNLLPDMAIARALLREAVEKKWSVTIFGDYDADGTPAAAVLAMTCERLGLTHQVILPTRKTGYGINMETIEGIKDSCQLLITVDTGITAIEEVALAKKYAIKVIIIDHHLPKSIIPNADAVIDPFVPSSKYPFKYLCGCALAYKLVVALQEDFPQQITVGFSKWLLDLVAISTVADMMPIVGENRVLVH
ncbi:MAG: DHH family phosphoesterase, partial [Patescibacteria group bacterium]